MLPLAWTTLVAMFFVPSPLSLLLATAEPTSPEVRGTTRCPSPPEVLAHLKPLLSDEASLPPTDWLELRELISPGAAPA
ncbi:MAG: hypothetical protein ABI560_11595, partial [Myxococcales bacterium]